MEKHAKIIPDKGLVCFRESTSKIVSTTYHDVVLEKLGWTNCRVFEMEAGRAGILK
jgi:hypothetical protein